MSSSFTNQPSPHDPRPDEGYTSTPPLPERGRDENEVAAVGPKLGSLAQKARGKKLKEARGILFVIGGLTILFNGIFLFMVPHFVGDALNQEISKQGGVNRVDPVLVEQARTEMLALNYTITGLFFGMGILFVVFGALVYRFPLAMTITSLVLYLLATLAMVLVNPAALASGAIVRIIFIVALAKSIRSAYAYEKELRAENEDAFRG
ncbi:MAG TPA: hypothetical protein VMG10_27355 [Gemmataceae bacterium]|nr:hypothetical protein [Gemmataceae bacterium]